MSGPKFYDAQDSRQGAGRQAKAQAARVLERRPHCLSHLLALDLPWALPCLKLTRPGTPITAGAVLIMSRVAPGQSRSHWPQPLWEEDQDAHVVVRVARGRQSSRELVWSPLQPSPAAIGGKNNAGSRKSITRKKEKEPGVSHKPRDAAISSAKNA